MSNFVRRTKNPRTGQFEDAFWLDNHFGHHAYGVQFRSDGAIYRADSREWEFDDRPAGNAKRPADPAEAEPAGADMEQT